MKSQKNKKKKKRRKIKVRESKFFDSFYSIENYVNKGQTCIGW